jgi:Cu/Ag efflux pump CusA
MEKKSLEDWLLEKSFKSVKGVVDVSSFGGPTKEYQIKLDPEKLVAYGLSIGQVEQQVANNNTNGGGSFIEQGAQQINVQSLGLYTSVQDIEDTVIKTSERHRHHHQRHRHRFTGCEDPAWSNRESDASARWKNRRQSRHG